MAFVNEHGFFFWSVIYFKTQEVGNHTYCVGALHSSPQLCEVSIIMPILWMRKLWLERFRNLVSQPGWGGARTRTKSV